MTVLINSASVILMDFLRSLVVFPFWWYGAGLARVSRWLWGSVGRANESLAWSLLGRNLFRPMYGDYTYSGRLISLCVRLAQFAVLSLILLLVVFIHGLLLLLWLAAVPVAVFYIVMNATA